MRKIILVIIMIWGVNTLYSQRILNAPATPSQNGDYIKDDRIDEYIGTWEWQSDNNKLVIVIKKQKIEFRIVPDFIACKDLALGGINIQKTVF